MLLLTSTSDKLQVVTTGTTTVDVHASYIDLLSGAVTAGRTNSKIVTGAPTTTDVVAAPSGSTVRNVKTLHVHNVHASAITTVSVQHTDGSNVVILETVSLAAGERIAYIEGQGFNLVDANGLVKVVSPLVPGTVARLAGDQSNATVTPTEVTGLTKPCGVGTWLFEYFIYYLSSVSTTGVRFSVNHTGTVTSFLANQRWVDVSATAATSSASQAAVATTGQVVGAMSARAKSTAGWGATVGTDSTGDMLMLIEGMTVVTVAGNIALYHGSETAASTTIKAGSSLRLTQTG